MASTINALTSGGGLAVSGDTSGSLQLQTNNGTTAMTIDTSQNVGIGTTSPSQKLEVASSNSVGSYATFRLNSPYYNYYDLVNDGGLAFKRGSTEQMRLDSSGNLLVNTTTQPNATSAQTAIVYDGNTKWGSVYKTTAVSGNPSVFLNSSATVCGFISTTTSATAYNTSSDYRLKENITPMQNALGVVAQLKPVTYTWKADGSDGQGFIAHELQEVVPDCVTGEKDAVDEEGKPVYQGIDTSFLVATLTAAIQELNAKVTALESQLGAK